MSVKSASESSSVAAHKRGPYRRRRLVTFAGLLASALRADAKASRQITWPNARADLDPEWFFHDILGVELWGRQSEAAKASVDHARLAIASGHKTGKSFFVTGLALSKYCAYDDSRVVMTSTTSRQVDAILWRQLKQLIYGSGVCLDCKRAGYPLEKRPCPHSAVIDGQIGDLARTGLKSGFREIVGFTAREPEAVAGISGANLWYFADEASGIPESIFEAIEGNRAGGAQIILTSNPTKTSGTFFDAFNTKKHSWETITISSEETPNCTIAPGTVPGLAGPEWIREKEEEWGRESAFFKVRVLGLFPLNEDGKIFSISLITEAQERYASVEIPKPGSPDARLFIGLDPAGPTGMGDETALCVRRGNRIIELEARRGLTDEGHVAWVLATCNKYRWPGEVPVVVLDREGKIGSTIYGLFRSIEARNENVFEIAAVRASTGAQRKPHVFDRIRDELASNLEDWLQAGGTLPPDTKLEQELHTLEWFVAINGKTKLMAKTKIREILQRSPDRYDALALACWVPAAMAEEKKQTAAAQQQQDGAPNEDGPDRSLDPYDAANLMIGY